MAYMTANASAAARPGFLRRMGYIILETLTWFANAHSMINEVERLTKASDAELQARGTSRQAEIQRIFGPRALY
jgi:hypothetical protein